MKISLIIPFHEDYDLLGSALQSVVQQRRTPDEVILVYNGKNIERVSNFTGSILNRYKMLNLKLLTTGAVGVAAARNIGIKHAEGEYICFLDIDDVMRINRLSSQCDFLDENLRIDAVSSWYSLFQDSSGTVKVPESHDVIKYSCFYWQSFFISGSMLRKQIFIDESNYFDPNISVAEDCDWLIRLVSKGFVFHNLSESLTSYRIHSKSLSHCDKRHTLVETVRVKRKALGLDLRNGFESFERNPILFTELSRIKESYPTIYTSLRRMQLYWSYTNCYNAGLGTEEEPRVSIARRLGLVAKLFLVCYKSLTTRKVDWYIFWAATKLAFSYVTK
jgi:glycosyltransferase involved in cell wall biosynthesis